MITGWGWTWKEWDGIVIGVYDVKFQRINKNVKWKHESNSETSRQRRVYLMCWSDEIIPHHSCTPPGVGRPRQHHPTVTTTLPSTLATTFQLLLEQWLYELMRGHFKQSLNKAQIGHQFLLYTSQISTKISVLFCLFFFFVENHKSLRYLEYTYFYKKLFLSTSPRKLFS